VIKFINYQKRVHQSVTPHNPISRFRLPWNCSLLYLSSPTKQRAQTILAASTQLPFSLLISQTFRFCVLVSSFLVSPFGERIHQGPGLNLCRTNHPSYSSRLTPFLGGASGPQSCPQRGDLLRVVDQDPLGFWFGIWGYGPRGVVRCGDECPVSGR
jgi:hypothetical protein